MKRILTILVCLLVAGTASAQIWSENFDDGAIAGKGAVGVDGTTTNIDLSGVTNWGIDVSACNLQTNSDWFRVESQRVEAQDVEGAAIWTSHVVNISSYAEVSFSLEALESGDHEGADYLDVSYSVDGGAFTMITNWHGFGSAAHTFVGDIPDDTDWVAETVTVYNITGNTLQLKVTMLNNGGGEYLRLDNVVISTNTAATDLPPVLAAIGNKTVVQSNQLTFAVTATDATDGDTVTLSASNLPPGATFITETNSPTASNDFVWAAPNPVGVYTTLFWAVDNDGTDSESVVIRVEPAPAPAELMLNEILVNPFGTDDNREYIEIKGAPSRSLVGITLLEIEADNKGGVIDHALDLSTLSLGTNGLIIIGHGYTTNCPWTPPSATTKGDLMRPSSAFLENGAVTFLLVTGFTGSVSDDLDTDTDGILDVTPWAGLLDAVGWEDGAGDCVYSPAKLTQSSGTPDAATRSRTNALSPLAAAWFNGDTATNLLDTMGITYDTNAASANLPLGAFLTPGDENYELVLGDTPTITITNPATESVGIPNATDNYTIQGSCNTSVIGHLSWTNSLTGGAGIFSAATSWDLGFMVDVGVNVVTVSGTNKDGLATSDMVTITRGAPTPLSGMTAFINEVECNGAGVDTNDFIEIVAPAGTNLQGCFIVHYNGDAGDGEVWRFIFPSFVMLNDGVTDTNGSALGFCVVAFTSYVTTADFELPAAGFQQGPDGVILYDQYTNILDAVAWGGAGDLPTDDPGTVVITGDPAAPNYLHVTMGDSGTEASLQAPNQVMSDTGTGWVQAAATPGAVNNGQTGGLIDITGGGNPDIPELAITNPPAASVVLANAYATVDVQGTANTNVTGQILWTNSLTGGSGSIAASTTWSISGVPLSVGVNVITVTGTNATDEIITDTVSVQREVAATYTTHPIVFFNEIEANSSGTDTGDYVEVIAPAGTNLQGCFIVHYNGDEGSDGGLWRFTFPSFVVPDDGVTDTNGVALGFCLIGQTAGVANTDFELPGGLQGGPDGLILYDANSNILDVVAMSGPGDMTTDDPGTVFTMGDPTANNYVKYTTSDTANTNTTLQAPNDVRNQGVGLSLWLLYVETPGAINSCQTSGYIIVTTELGGGGGPVDTDGDGMSDDYETTYFTNATAGVAGNDDDGDGFSNLEEYLADTIPNGAAGSNSLFEIQTFTNSTPQSFVFPSSTGRVYTLQTSSDLLLGNSWSNLQTDVQGDGGPMTLTDPVQTGGRDYRLRVRVP